MIFDSLMVRVMVIIGLTLRLSLCGKDLCDFRDKDIIGLTRQLTLFGRF